MVAVSGPEPVSPELVSVVVLPEPSVLVPALLPPLVVSPLVVFPALLLPAELPLVALEPPVLVVAPESELLDESHALKIRKGHSKATADSFFMIPTLR